MMQSLGRRYVQYFNNEYRRSGTLWEGRFKSCLIQEERYLLEVYWYIELNPARAEYFAETVRTTAGVRAVNYALWGGCRVTGSSVLI